jgi:drug/metabolite transporter (DMT)-like permease
LKTAAGLAAVYSIWGSTYLFIRFAVETLPPFLMVGTRVSVAGIVLIVSARLRGMSPPEPAQWGWAALTGALTLSVGSGGVGWAAQIIPSGLTSVFVAPVPLWMVLLNWLGFERMRPGLRETVGVGLGLAGIALLVGPGNVIGQDVGHVDPLGAAVLILASLGWGTGSLLTRYARLPDSSMLTTGMQMVAGGLILYVAGVSTGEVARLGASTVSTRSLLSLIYLIALGSVVAFSAYTWLIRETTPALAASYAYVNPVVAVLLGWALGGERLTQRMIAAAAIIVIAVVLITTGQNADSGEGRRLEAVESPPPLVE